MVGLTGWNWKVGKLQSWDLLLGTVGLRARKRGSHLQPLEEALPEREGQVSS